MIRRVLSDALGMVALASLLVMGLWATGDQPSARDPVLPPGFFAGGPGVDPARW